MSGQQRSKLLDAAASRVGIEVDPETELTLGRKRAREKAAAAREGLGDDDDDDDSSDGGETNGGKKRARKNSSNSKKKKNAEAQTLDFLIDNIGRGAAVDNDRYGKINEGDEDSNPDDSDDEDANFVLDATDEFRRLPEEERRVLFMARYREELARQLKLLAESASFADSSFGMVGDEEDDRIEWEEG